MPSAPLTRFRNGNISAFANPASSGSNTILAAQGAGVKIQVTSVVLLASAAVTATFKSATTDITADFSLSTSSGFVLPYSDAGWFQTAANEALTLTLDGAVAVAVQYTYRLTQY